MIKILVKVECPLCGSVGEAILPPGGIIIGDCPGCNAKVMIYFFDCLLLDSDIMDSDSADEKLNHVVGILAEHIRNMLRLQMFGQPAEEFTNGMEINQSTMNTPSSEGSKDQITDGDVDHFLKNELGGIDDSGKFRKAFKPDEES